MTDEELLGAVASGDQHAMSVLFDRYREPVLAFATAVLRDPEAAREVLSDAMLAIWKGARRVRDRSRVRIWILGLAAQQVQAQRGQRRLRASAFEDHPKDEDGADALLTPLLPAARQVLPRSLEKLLPAQREVLHLAFYGDCSCSEIAQILNVPAGAVRSRIHAGVRALRRRLQNKGALP